MAHDWRNPERVQPWKPRQRFLVTTLGRQAVERYHETIGAAQDSADPRTALESAKQTWAVALSLRPTDAMVLEDLAAGHTSLAELRGIARGGGTEPPRRAGCADRLKAAALIEPVADGAPA
jgi:hypothetical protein